MTDLVVTSASLTHLQQLTDICTEEGKSIDMIFNAPMLLVVRIGQNFRHQCIAVLFDD